MYEGATINNWHLLGLNGYIIGIYLCCYVYIYIHGYILFFFCDWNSGESHQSILILAYVYTIYLYKAPPKKDWEKWFSYHYFSRKLFVFLYFFGMFCIDRLYSYIYLFTYLFIFVFICIYMYLFSGLVGDLVLSFVSCF
jgi:hypothetical protein